MTQKNNLGNSVVVNAVELRRDIDNSGMTLDGIIAEMNAPIDKSTLNKAIKGDNVLTESLNRIALALDQPKEKYIREVGKIVASTSYDITGEWAGYYIEPSIELVPERVEICMAITQHRAELSIRSYEIGSDGEERGDVYIEAFLVGDLVMITSYVRGWEHPAGITSTMLKVEKGTEILSGQMIWYDKDAPDIQTSKFILAKKGTYSYEDYLARAKAELTP